MIKSSSKQTEIEYRRRLVASIFHRGITSQFEIAAVLKDETGLEVDRSTVSRDLRALRAQWRKEAEGDIKDAIGETLAETERLKREYWEAWQRSLEEFRSKTVKAKGATPEAAKASAEQTLRTEDRNGDPRYLAGVQWCIDRRCKLLGLDAPQKVAPVNPEGTGEYSGGLVILPAKGGDGVTVQGNGQ